jgi:hypothetical protein
LRSRSKDQVVSTAERYDITQVPGCFGRVVELCFWRSLVDGLASMADLLGACFVTGGVARLIVPFSRFCPQHLHVADALVRPAGRGVLAGQWALATPL